MLVASRTGVALVTVHVAAALVLGALVFSHGDEPYAGVDHGRWLLVHLHLAVLGWLTLLIVTVGRTLAPMRDAVRRVVDDAVELERGGEVFPHDVEVAFGSAYDKFLRALDGLEITRDLLASVRDFHQSKIANDQNEVMKVLTVIASLLLLPTFIVGVYGQNFVNIPELRWHLGYAFSWGVIVATTFGQLWFFKRKNWI